MSIYFINEFLIPAVMSGFKVLDGRREEDRVWGEADNKNVFSNLSFICRDSCNDYKLP